MVCRRPLECRRRLPGRLAGARAAALDGGGGVQDSTCGCTRHRRDEWDGAGRSERPALRFAARARQLLPLQPAQHQAAGRRPLRGCARAAAQDPRERLPAHRRRPRTTTRRSCCPSATPWSPREERACRPRPNPFEHPTQSAVTLRRPGAHVEPGVVAPRRLLHDGHPHRSCCSRGPSSSIPPLARIWRCPRTV